MKTKWKTLNEVAVPDVEAWVRAATRDGQHLHIGCDSLQTGRFTQYVTVLVIHTPMKGGRVAYCREIVPRVNSMRERLMKEVWHSTEIAMQLSPIVKGDLTVHIDASPEEKNMSNKYLKELVGLVVGQGFKALYKPDSFAATHAADHIVRHVSKFPRKVA